MVAINGRLTSELMRRRKLKYSLLALMCGTDEGNLARILSGRQLPAVDLAIRLAQALGTSVEALWGGGRAGLPGRRGGPVRAVGRCFISSSGYVRRLGGIEGAVYWRWRRGVGLKDIAKELGMSAGYAGQVVERVVLRRRLLENLERLRACRRKGGARLEDLPLSGRIVRRLNLAGVKTIGDLLRIGPEAVLRLEGLGLRAVEEVTALMFELGLGGWVQGFRVKPRPVYWASGV